MLQALAGLDGPEYFILRKAPLLLFLMIGLAVIFLHIYAITLSNVLSYFVSCLLDVSSAFLRFAGLSYGSSWL